MSDSPQIRLDELAPCKCGVVRTIEAPDEELQRLMAMGVCADRIVEMIQPGDPMIIRVYGTRIGVSARLGNRIVVEPCAETNCFSDPHEQGV